MTRTRLALWCIGVLLLTSIAGCGGGTDAASGSTGIPASQGPIDKWLWGQDVRAYGQDAESTRASAERLRSILVAVASSNERTRQNAVVELLKVRAMLSAGLQKIVADANQKLCPEGPKASAIFLMGELGLLECKELLQNEEDWKYYEPCIFDDGPYDQREESLLGRPAHIALGRACFGEAAKFVRYAAVAAPEDYPELAKALLGLRSSKPLDRRQAEDGILLWNRELGSHLSNYASTHRYGGTLPTEVRLTAAFLLGEWRSLNTQMLEWFVDLEDSKDITLHYPRSIEVSSPSPGLPCANALLKVGRRSSPYQVFSHAASWESVSPEACRLLARIMMLSQPDRTRQEYDKQMQRLTAPGGSTPKAEKAKRATRLKIMEDIIVKGIRADGDK